MKIENVRVYGLEESIIASGLPMMESFDAAGFDEICRRILDKTNNEQETIRHLRRARALSGCKGGESHDCFLCGIVVQMNVTAPRYWWPEFQRYHFADIVSSTSTMHRLSSFVKRMAKLLEDGDFASAEEEKSRHFAERTDHSAIDRFLEVASPMVMRDEIDVETIKANLPEGWLQTARITTNYRQIKTMCYQRSKHRLTEWREFCRILKDELPMSELFWEKDDELCD